jgi:hypothetical protein
MSDFADLVGTWADWATAVIDEWPDDPCEAEPAWHILDQIAGGTGPGAHRADR